MTKTLPQAFISNLLGASPEWYKLTIAAFLIANPILLQLAGPFVTGWVLIAEFIFTLAMALSCYPLPAGGLLALEAVILGMTSPETLYNEALHNFPVILLLIFMVAGIYFMKDMLQYTFTKLLIKVRSKILLSLLFCFAGAFLSAFLDALTVTAVIIAVALGFYEVYHRHASAGKCILGDETGLDDACRRELKGFRGFLRNLMMHGAVGTALGGVCTLVGEPQNLLVAHEMGWHFAEFFIKVAPVSMPVLAVGLLTCVGVERFRLFGYGHTLPATVRRVLAEDDARRDAGMTNKARAILYVQAAAAIYLVIALAMHLAEVGLIGLSIIILLTAFCGRTEEHQIGNAFTEALPFTALLVVFFAIVAVIHDQHLFAPVIGFVLSLSGKTQTAAYYLANGLLSMISDNVFVATVYITETKAHFIQLFSGMQGLGMSGADLLAKLTDAHIQRADVLATLPKEVLPQVTAAINQFDRLAVAINTGTNIPSVATPNGQAAFLFLLTSALAPLIRLSYGQMVRLALPYTITMTATGLIAVWVML
ncbi:Na+H+ antiporter NhaB [Solidesulfovibrio fructosivorans JJ]]|uniref:Na+H+ antiporter NhaB n=1 Tax=Solidesulfovibrio fructosivorans JJ] TaxID=596151 RepID=E1JS76_SOLFR|nr:sodium/proton antiporter NhaB [Solidesulfovibrio fructosivorans]EFL52845.1 Na+H+ antiporter NhaB [Solidesulfovibrio fructosivorans JJ]]